MSALKKLAIKNVSHRNVLTPGEVRRKKLVAKIDQQFSVLDAALKGLEFKSSGSRWAKNDQGERVREDVNRTIRAWFFGQDGGYIVQCKYGSKVLQLSKDGNAVFVKQLADVKAVLEAFRAAASNGELDGYIEQVLKARKVSQKKAA